MERTLRQNIDLLMQMFADDFDWDAYYEQDDSESIEALFRACIIVGFPEEEDTKQYIECGSAEVEDTPKALYRLLFLLRSEEKLDFHSMYKGFLTSFFSADKRFLVAVHFFKYELGLYFYAPPETIIGRGHAVIAGAPGADNGWRCDDADGLAFFDMIQRAINREWEVYGGNDFCV